MAIALAGVVEIFAALPGARIAGGAVRDHLLGVAFADVDFATPLPPRAVLAGLAARGVKAVPTGIAHGTITAVIGGRGFEITTLRRDLSTDGRHARVAFTDDWREDAARRDFTINAMSMDAQGTVFDYFAGRDDLRAGSVRFVGDARARVAEDYLRILRFFRFHARYGRGAPDARALAAITELRDGIAKLSAERIWSESKRILQTADPRETIALMRDTGVLQLIFPQGADLPALHRLLAAEAPAEPLLRLAALLRGEARDFTERLKLSLREAAFLQAARQPNTLHPGVSEAELRRALAAERREILLARSWLAATADPGWPALRARIAAAPPVVFPLQGRDLLELGIGSGRRIGEILAATREWWYARGCRDGLADCRDKAAEIAARL